MALTGYMVNGLCYDTADQAAAVVQSTAPRGGGAATDYISSVVLDASGTFFNVGMSYQDYINTMYNYTVQWPVSRCDPSVFSPSALGVLTPPVDVAVQLVLAIWLVWTVGFGIRMLIRTIGNSAHDAEGDE